MDRRLKTNDEADIRRMLRPLAALAERRGLLVVVLCHVNKGQGSPGQRIMGGAAWRNAPRLVLLAGVPDQQHPSETDQRMLVVEKSNLGRFPAAVGFRLATFTDNPDLADAEWGQEHQHVTAGDLVTSAADPDDRHALDEAVEWLSEALGNGPKPASELLTMARKDGIAERTLRRANKRVGVTTAKAGFDGGWNWSLPEAANTTLSVTAVATFEGNDCKPPANHEDARRWSTQQRGNLGGPFDGQAVFGTNSPEDGQPSQAQDALATSATDRTMCKRCNEPCRGPGTVCDPCLDGGA